MSDLQRPVAFFVTQFDPNGALLNNRQMVAAPLPPHYNTENWGSAGHKMWQVEPLYAAATLEAAGAEAFKQASQIAEFYGEWAANWGQHKNAVVAQQATFEVAVALRDPVEREKAWKMLVAAGALDTASAA